MKLEFTPEQIAAVVHAANTALQGILGDPLPSSYVLANEDAEIQESAVHGVRLALTGMTPEQMHKEWCDFKRAHGWTYGPEKDPEQKTHPCLVEWNELPDRQKIKDIVFLANVRALAVGA